MAGPTIKLPMDDAPFKRVVDQIKEAKKEQRDLQREMKKSGSDAARLSAQLQQVEGKLANLQRMQGGGGGTSLSGYNPGDFFTRKGGVAPRGPNLPWSNDEHQRSRSSVSIAGTANNATMMRAAGIRDALGRGDVFGAIRGNTLDWMHRKGGFIGSIAGGVESGALARGGVQALTWKAGLEITKAVVSMASPYSEDIRLRESNARIATGMDVNERQLYESELAQQRSRDKYMPLQSLTNAIGELPIVGEKIAGILNKGGSAFTWTADRIAGRDSAARQHGQFRQLLGAEAEDAMKIWEKRYFANKYGSELVGSMAQQINSAMKYAKLESNDAAQGSVDMAKNSVDRYKYLESQGYQLVAQNNFVAAEAKFQESAKEMSRPKWKNPMETWFQEDANRPALIFYARSQQQAAVPPVRIGY